MKIARILLTASILLSLKSTLFCSVKNASDAIKLERKDSFDPLRDRNGVAKALGTTWFGYNPQKLADYTLQHCGEDYENKQMRPGSNAESIQVWDQHIQTLENAQQFITATENVKDSISGLPYYKKAQGLIEADKQHKINQWKSLNQASVTLLQTYHSKNQQKESEDAKLSEKYEIKKQQAIAAFDADLANERKAIAQERAQEKEELVTTLQQNFDAMEAFDAPPSIKQLQFVANKNGITKGKLSKLSTKFKDGQVKNRTYAQALQDDTEQEA